MKWFDVGCNWLIFFVYLFTTFLRLQDIKNMLRLLSLNIGSELKIDILVLLEPTSFNILKKKNHAVFPCQNQKFKTI